MLINFTVFNRTKGNTLLPWRTRPVQPQITFRGFFYSEASPIIPGCHDRNELELSQVYVGKSKDVLDFVDSDVEVSEVIEVFGPYAKFIVE